MQDKLMRTRVGRATLFFLTCFLLMPGNGYAESGKGSWEKAPAPPFVGNPVLLKDGKVFVPGKDADEKKAAIYDSATGKWKVLSVNRPFPQVATAGVLADGRVLMVASGGQTLIFDPKTNQTQDGPPVPSRVGGGDSVALTLLPAGPKSVCGSNCGKMLLTGACYDIIKSVGVLFDSTNNTWGSPIQPIEKQRCHHAAVLMPNGKVLISGGDNGDARTYFRSAEIFDPLTSSFVPTGQSHYLRTFAAGVRLKTGKILVTGAAQPCNETSCPSDTKDKSSELYDPASGTWTDTGDTLELSQGGLSPAPTVLGNGKVFVDFPSVSADKAAELYDPATGKWDYAAPVPGGGETGFALGYAVQLSNRPCGENCGKVLVLGAPGAAPQLYSGAGLSASSEGSSKPTPAAAKAKGASKSVLSPVWWVVGAGAVVLLLLFALLGRRRKRTAD